MISDSPIGVYDSGLGGLSVLKALATKFPQENFVYLGDTARLPYGNRSPEDLKEIVSECLEYLNRQPCKFVVVACNSASTSIVSPQKNILGVIQAGALEALSKSKAKKIGVLGTRATVTARAYSSYLKAIDPLIEVFEQEAPLLVPLVEEGWTDDPITNLVIYRYTSSMLTKSIDTLILGCTHYPFLSKSIQRVVGPDVLLADSSEMLGSQLGNYFLENPSHKKKSPGRFVKVLTTQDSAGYRERAQRFLENIKIDEYQKITLRQL
jgi:glutamate racemase